MKELLPFVIAGLVSGSVYGLAGTGLVLSYKTSGIFNFAHGALATVAAYLFYTLHYQHHLAWPVAALICVIGLGLGMGVAMELFTRRLVLTPIAQRIAGTVGVMILLQAIFVLTYGEDGVIMKPFLPHHSYMVDGVAITMDQIIIVVIGIVVTVALYLYLQRSRQGMAMRAVVDNPELLSLSQFDPRSTRRNAWMIGCILATLSGVLIAPSLSLTPEQLTLLVVQAFAAAAVGQFTSLPRTYVGGLVIGVIASVCTKYVESNQTLAGLPAAIPFIILFLLLAVTPKNRWRLTSLRRLPLTLSAVPRVSVKVQMLGAAPLLVLLILAPLFVGSTHVLVWGQGLVFLILFASMALLVRVAGQVSLCHVAFAAIGASTFARLAGSSHLHLPWFLALVLASLIVVPIGAILALPASRLPVLFLGLATLGFGLLVQQLFYSTNLMFSPFAEGLNVGRPYLGGFSLGSDTRYYYLVLIIAVVSVAAIIALVRARTGRLLMGLSDSPLALNALGADERVTRVLVFCISAFFAGLSGALYAGLLGNVADTTFDPLASLTYLVVIVIAVGDPLWAAVGGAIGIAVIPGYVESGHINDYLQVAFGAIAIGVAVAPAHLKVNLDRLFPDKARRKAEGGEEKRATPVPVTAPKPAVTGGLEVAVSDVTVRFGGTHAVDGVSLVAPPNRITGLIGPNGAGKTTTFNVCSGLLKPTAGRVALDGRNVTSKAPSSRARLGLGRTFQQTELFSSMTVRENLVLGSEASFAGASPWSQVFEARSERTARDSAVAAAVELCGVGDLLEMRASALSTGQRRLVEIARCVAGPVKAVLLDEPSAGLDPAETEHLGQVLRALRDERQLAILLVEHDMELVMDVCDYIYVLDFGKLVFEGTPPEVQASPVVQLAYLGEPMAEEVAP